ncbi:hypothetical protein ACHWQZ_G005369 [Mnemiopsis leidyi]
MLSNKLLVRSSQFPGNSRISHKDCNCDGLVTVLKLEQSLLNPDSTILNLLHVIKQLCSLGDKPEDLDLCTLQGVVANLTTASLRSSARPLLTDRTAYIVVKVIRSDNYIRYFPLCHNSLQTKDFVKVLREQERIGTASYSSSRTSLGVDSKEARYIEDLTSVVKCSSRRSKNKVSSMTSPSTLSLSGTTSGKRASTVHK